jgi:hypothetical protein
MLTGLPASVVLSIAKALEDHRWLVGERRAHFNLRLSSKTIAATIRSYVLKRHGGRRRIPFTQAGLDDIRKADRLNCLDAIEKIAFLGSSLRKTVIEYIPIRRGNWQDDYPEDPNSVPTNGTTRTEEQEYWLDCPEDASNLLTNGTWTQVLKSISPRLKGLREIMLESPDTLGRDLWLSKSYERLTVRLWHMSISCVFFGLLPNLEDLITLRVATCLKWATTQRLAFLPMTSLHTVFSNGSNYSSLTVLHLGLELDSLDYHYGKQCMPSFLSYY